MLNVFNFRMEKKGLRKNKSSVFLVFFIASLDDDPFLCRGRFFFKGIIKNYRLVREKKEFLENDFHKKSGFLEIQPFSGGVLCVYAFWVVVVHALCPTNVKVKN